MSGQTGKWREEQILIICPGSQTTMAQLGCNELTPPARRFPTRMFKDDESDEWHPHHTYKRRKATANGTAAAAAGDGGGGGGDDNDEWEYVEDVDSTEGAVYPIQGEFSPLSNKCRKGKFANSGRCCSWPHRQHGRLPGLPRVRPRHPHDDVP